MNFSKIYFLQHQNLHGQQSHLWFKHSGNDHSQISCVFPLSRNLNCGFFWALHNIKNINRNFLMHKNLIVLYEGDWGNKSRFFWDYNRIKLPIYYALNYQCTYKSKGPVSYFFWRKFYFTREIK